MTTSTRWLTILLLAAAVPAARAGDEGGEGSRPFRMPPQEAQAACAKLEAGAPCSFAFDGRAHTGVCRRGPQGEGPLACDPHGAGPGGSGGEPGKRAPQPQR